jgi:hypothetical protein
MRKQSDNTILGNATDGTRRVFALISILQTVVVSVLFRGQSLCQTVHQKAVPNHSLVVTVFLIPLDVLDDSRWNPHSERQSSSEQQAPATTSTVTFRLLNAYCAQGCSAITGLTESMFSGSVAHSLAI